MIRLSWSFTRAVRIPLLAVLLLAFAGAAQAESAPASLLFVDNNGDTSGGACTIAPSDCSLRSAIEVANLNPGSVIEFGADYNIVLGSALPAISANDTGIYGQTHIIKINANNATRAFEITADRVQIDNLYLSDATAGQSLIYIHGSAVGVKISRNTIGNINGFPTNCRSSNAYGGIYVKSTGGNLAGGARVWIYGNHIECNLGSPGDGITLVGTDNVMIGEDAAHNAVPNTIDHNNTGISMINSAALNTVHGNMITENNGKGIWINNSSLNIVQTNTITGSVSSGVLIDGGSFGNLIGSPQGGPTTAGNLISGNTGDGVYISDAGTSGNLVYGNRIGTDASGSSGSGNGGSGVVLNNGAHDNAIGRIATERNIISGNTGDGVLIGNTAHDNFVKANFIGTNISGTAALSNQNGVEIYNGAYSNIIGGAIGNRNLIGGNLSDGIIIDGSSTATNTVTSNDIGYFPDTATYLPDLGDHILLSDGTHANIIGGPGMANHLYAAVGNGISISAGAHGNQILANDISLDNLYGIVFDGANTTGNVISGTYIYGNGSACAGCDGIGERNGAGGNVWTQVAIAANAGLGIDKFITNDATNIVNPPNFYVTGVNFSTGVVQGFADPSGVSSHTTVELYQLALDPSGYGEGKSFVGSAVTNGSGHWSITDPNIVADGGCYTAFTTHHSNLNDTAFSSEFSRSSCSIFLPLIRR